VKCEARKKEDLKTRWKWWEWWRSIHREHDEWKFELSNEWTDEETNELHDIWFRWWESFRARRRRWLFQLVNKQAIYLMRIFE
jgi:hypothetical protein